VRGVIICGMCDKVMLIDTVLVNHAFHAEEGRSVFRFLLNQIGGIATIVSVFVQYVALDLMQGNLEPLCVGFTYIFGIQKCI
jgi:hypothetical protein